jgi:hypothetical protein
MRPLLIAAQILVLPASVAAEHSNSGNAVAIRGRPFYGSIENG